MVAIIPGTLHYKPTMTSLSVLQIPEIFSDETTLSIVAVLTDLGDQARNEHLRNELGIHIPKMISILQKTTTTHQILDPTLRALGNIVIDNDANRQLSLDHGIVPILLHLLQQALDVNDQFKLHKIQRNLLGAISNLVCDNSTLQQYIIKAGAIPLLCRAATTGNAKNMACQAALCLDSSILLTTIAFDKIDEIDEIDNTNKNTTSLDLQVIATVVDGLVDLVDEDGAALQEMKSSARNWVDSTIELAALILNTTFEEEEEEEETKDHENNNKTSSSTSTTSTTSSTFTLTDSHAAALHNCAGLLSRSFRISGRESFNNMSSTSLTTLHCIIVQLCQLPISMYSADLSPLPETLGIFTGALSSICADLTGCVRVFQAEAEGGIMAASNIQIEQNKAIQSAGLVALRNLCLTCHQNLITDQRDQTIANDLHTAAMEKVLLSSGSKGACSATKDVSNGMEEQKAAFGAVLAESPRDTRDTDTHETSEAATIRIYERRMKNKIPLPSEFCPAVCVIAFDSGCQHVNKNLALSGVALLRQAIGNTNATFEIIRSFLTARENSWDWLLNGFRQDGMEDGNKGQCECARIVCLVVGKCGNINMWKDVLGCTVEKEQNVIRCAKLLIDKFEDDTLKMEGELCLERLKEFGVKVLVEVDEVVEESGIEIVS